jgi:O-antigen ligase
VPIDTSQISDILLPCLTAACVAVLFVWVVRRWPDWRRGHPGSLRYALRQTAATSLPRLDWRSDYGGDGLRRTLLVTATVGLVATGAVVVGGVIGAVGVAVAAVALTQLRFPERIFLFLLASWAMLAPYLILAVPGPLPDLNYERVSVALLVVMSVVILVGSRRAMPGLGWWVSAYLILQIGTYLFWSLGDPLVPPELSILMNSTLLPVGVYWLTKVYGISARDRVRVMVATLIGIVLVFLTGIYERLINAVASPFPVTLGTASGLRYLDVPHGRAGGIVGNPAIYGALMGVGVLLVFALWNSARTRVRQGVLLATGLLLSYGLVVSYTRSAWVSAAAGFAVAAVVSRLVRKPLLIAGTVVTLGLLTLMVFSPEILSGNDLLQNRVLETGNVTGRSSRASYSWQVFLEHPVIGAGPGALDARIGAKFAGEGFDTSHNTYLTILVDSGVIVALVFAGVFNSWAVASVTRLRDSSVDDPDRPIIAALVGIIIIYLLSGMALELKWFPYFTSLIWMAGAMIEMVALDKTPAPPTSARQLEVVR